ncbi:MAG: GspH/FimT family pseudopilin [Reinekea sp.]
MKQKGLTLVELLTAVSILVLITTFAVPNFSRFQERISYDKTRNHWLTFLKTGRANAISLQATITACPFDFLNNHCSDNLNNDWLMFIDDNKNKKLDINEESIQVLMLDDKTSIRFYPKDRKYIRFYNKPSGLNAGLMTGLTICPHGVPDVSSVHIKINIMGRVRSSTSRDSKGVIFRESGAKRFPIKC